MQEQEKGKGWCQPGRVAIEPHGSGGVATSTAQQKVIDADVTRLEGRVATKPPQGRWIHELEERATPGEMSRSRRILAPVRANVYDLKGGVQEQEKGRGWC